MLLMQGYVMWHVWRVLPLSLPIKLVIMLLMVLALVCMVLQFKSEWMPLWAATATYEIGNSWLIIMFYLLMAFLLLDVGRLVHLVPSGWLHGNAMMSLALTIVMLVIFVGGNIHYHNKLRQELHFTTSKPLDKPLKIVMVSDLHMGYHNRRAEVGRWVDMINAEHPDMVLVAGDIIDGQMRPVLEQGTAQEMTRLEAPVVACPGNHDAMTGMQQVEQWSRQAGIALLRDSVVTCCGVTVVGRDDRSNPRRKQLEQVMADADTTSYTIVLDHQPYHLEAAEQCGADLQLSGHTHHGQVWPLNWVTRAMYECDYGQWHRGATDYYISSGIGIWGGKFRIGTSSEYAVIHIEPTR